MYEIVHIEIENLDCPIQLLRLHMIILYDFSFFRMECSVNVRVNRRVSKRNNNKTSVNDHEFSAKKAKN